jgi:hypothetical protein
MLYDWTKATSATLPDPSRTLFHFLCALEDADRLDWIVKQVWPEMWKALGLAGDAPGLETTLSAVKFAGLVEPQAQEKQVMYNIHPGVAQAGLDELDEKFRENVDSKLISFWISIYSQMLNGELEGKDYWVIKAGLRSAIYLIKQKKWTEAAAFLEPVVQRDHSPSTLVKVLPMLRHINEANKGTDQELTTSGFLATALSFAGRWKDAENIIRPLIIKFRAQGDFNSASAASTTLIKILYETGNLNEALEQVKERKEYTLKAGLGPWTLLSNEAQRLQVLNFLGKYEIVIETVEDLREQIKFLTENRNNEEVWEQWNVREVILDTGREAAMRSGKYRLALEYNAEMTTFARARGATWAELVKIKFNDVTPLLRLRQFKHAKTLIGISKEIFEKENDIHGQSCVFGALADLSYSQDFVDQAIVFGVISLRYSYRYGDPNGISLSHNNLALYLRNLGSKSAMDHAFAAMMVWYQMNSGMIVSSFKELTLDLAQFGPEALPESFDQLCDRVEQVQYVRFRELWERLPKRAEDGDQLLKELIEMAKSAKK